MRRLSLRGKPVAHRGGLPDLAKTHDSTTESTKANDFKHTAQTRKRPGKVYAPEPSSNKKKKHRQTTPGGWSPPPDHEIVQLSDSDFQGEPDEEEEEEEGDDEVVAARSVALKFDAKPVARTTELKPQARPQKKLARDVDATFLVKSSRIAKDKAVRDYPHRYIKKSKRKSESADQESQLPVIAHYKEAKVDGETYLLGDCVHVNNDTGHDYLGRIIELFEKEDSSEWFTVQWFFRASETAMGDQGLNLDKQRVFFSELHDDNPLDCITEKKTVIRLPSETRFHKGARVIPPCDYFFDKGYKYAYATFYELPESLSGPGWIDRTDSDVSTIENAIENGSSPISKSSSCHKSVKLDTQQCDTSETKTELQLLDLYSGCGAMSTGLCLGANLAGVNLITRWAVDYNEEACISLKHNHPETRVRKEAAEDFLTLLKEWKKLCDKFPESMDHDSQSSDESDVDTEPLEAGEYEVERLIGIRWVGDSKSDPEEEDDDEEGADESKLPNTSKKEQPELATNKGLEFKVKWKGYTEEENSWEPAASMDCPDLVKQFVIDGRRCKLLPLPGNVDVICGGPPCQGASGFNRFRNYEKPLDDPKNKQMVVYMDIVEFLRPRFILMENVVDILKFCDGILGRYALSRAVSMNYQGHILSTTGDSLIVSLFVEVAKQSSIKQFASFDHFGIFALGLM
ncbi:hypothetical protein BDL97_15G029700 [Sphagnum fallax]|nr:hypothetical protein BDL97_15G029700 [Sphagnum fallax]